MAPGLATRNKKLLITKGSATRSKDANPEHSNVQRGFYQVGLAGSCCKSSIKEFLLRHVDCANFHEYDIYDIYTHICKRTEGFIRMNFCKFWRLNPQRSGD